MKLATFKTGEDTAPRVGVVDGNRIVDLASCGFEGSMIELLKQGLDIDAIASKMTGGDALPLSGVSLLAPVPDPGKVLAIGLNYGDHIAESGMDAPAH